MPAETEIPQLIREEIDEQTQTLELLASYWEPLQLVDANDESLSWLDNRIGSVLTSIHELVDAYLDCGADLHRLTKVLMQSGFWGWEADYIRETYPDDDDTVPITLIRAMESEYGISTKNASRILCHLADDGCGLWRNMMRDYLPAVSTESHER